MLASAGQIIFIVDTVCSHVIGLSGACFSPALIGSGQTRETSVDLRKIGKYYYTGTSKVAGEDNRGLDAIRSDPEI